MGQPFSKNHGALPESAALNIPARMCTMLAWPQRAIYIALVILMVPRTTRTPRIPRIAIRDGILGARHYGITASLMTRKTVPRILKGRTAARSTANITTRLV